MCYPRNTSVLGGYINTYEHNASRVVGTKLSFFWGVDDHVVPIKSIKIIFEFALRHVQNKYKTYQVKTREWLIPPFFSWDKIFGNKLTFFSVDYNVKNSFKQKADLSLLYTLYRTNARDIK